MDTALAQKVEVKKVKDRRGDLFVLDGNIPFYSKRAFWVHNSGSVEWRGGHAHKKARQLIVSIKGKVEIVLKHMSMFGKTETKLTLEEGKHGLLVEPGVFISYRIQRGGTILVLASEPYDERDYIYEDKISKSGV